MIPKRRKQIYNKQGTTLFAIIFALIAILGFVSILSPEPSKTPEPAETFQTRSTYSGYLFRVVIVTLTMIVVLIVGLSVYKKQIKSKSKSNLTLNIIGRHYINDKQSLIKVHVEGKYLLLGVSETSINYITELERPGDDLEEQEDFGSILDLETRKETKA